MNCFRMFNMLTKIYFTAIGIFQNQSTNRELNFLTHFSVPIKAFFFLIHRIFKRVKTLELIGEPHVVFDSNRISGTVIEHEYSPNGEYCAFTLALENKKAHKCIVVNVKTSKILGNGLHLSNCKKVAWSSDSKGFFVYVNIYCLVTYI